MRAKIKSIFEALEILEQKNREAIAKSVLSGDDRIPNYGRSLIARNTLRQALAQCEMEIELPPSTETVLAPLLAELLLT